MKKLALHWIIIIIVLAITFVFLISLFILKVSKEILNSYYEVDLGIVKTTEVIDNKNLEVYERLTDSVVAGPYIALTNQLKPKTLELTDYIQNMKYDLVYTADGGEVYLEFYEDGNEAENAKYLVVDTKFADLENPRKRIAYLGAKGKRETSGHLFNPDNDGETGRATILKNMISDYRSFLLDILEQAEEQKLITSGSSSELIEEINNSLIIRDGESYGEKGTSWEHHNFYDMPAVSALILLSKWQADIKNMEVDVVSFLSNSVGVKK